MSTESEPRSSSLQPGDKVWVKAKYAYEVEKQSDITLVRSESWSDGFMRPTGMFTRTADVIPATDLVPVSLLEAHRPLFGAVAQGRCICGDAFISREGSSYDGWLDHLRSLLENQ